MRICDEHVLHCSTLSLARRDAANHRTTPGETKIATCFLVRAAAFRRPRARAKQKPGVVADPPLRIAGLELCYGLPTPKKEYISQYSTELCPKERCIASACIAFKMRTDMVVQHRKCKTLGGLIYFPVGTSSEDMVHHSEDLSRYNDTALQYYQRSLGCFVPFLVLRYFRGDRS